MLWSTFPDIQAQLEWAGCPPPPVTTSSLRRALPRGVGGER